MPLEARGLSARVIDTSDGFQIHLSGPRSGRINGALVAACANAAFACAEATGCLDKGLHLTNQCLESVVGHSLVSDCASEGFGLAANRGRSRIVSQESGPGLKVRVTEVADGVQLHVTGERARLVDAKQLASCANAAMACAEANSCLERGLDVTSQCVDTLLVGHAVAENCVEKGFGLALKQG